jgi:hypothetical protein
MPENISSSTLCASTQARPAAPFQISEGAGGWVFV